MVENFEVASQSSFRDIAKNHFYAMVVELATDIIDNKKLNNQ